MNNERLQNIWKVPIVIGILVIMSIFEWIEKHPYTTLWLGAVVAFIAYLVYEHTNKTSPPGNTPPSDHF